MLQRRYTLSELVGVLAVVALLLTGSFSTARAVEEDPRSVIYTTSGVLEPESGSSGNVLAPGQYGPRPSHTGTGIPIPLSGDPTVGDNEASRFMDWQELLRQRLEREATPVVTPVVVCPPCEAAVVRLLEKVNFAFDSSEIEAVYESDLDEAARILAEHPEINLRLYGHTDRVGTDEYNAQLATRRAEALQAALVKRGVAVGRLETISYGERFPVEDVLGRSRANRRVEVAPHPYLP